MRRTYRREDFAHLKVRYVLQREHSNTELVWDIRDHFFGSDEIRTVPQTKLFVHTVESSDLTVGEWFEHNFTADPLIRRSKCKQSA